MKKLILLTAIILLLTGCASVSVYDAKGKLIERIETKGVLRTITKRIDFYESGEIKTKVISSDSTTKDVLCGLNELLDSAVNTASKIKPL